MKLMNKQHILFRLLLTAMVVMLSTPVSFAQNKAGRELVKISVVDTSGTPVENARISSSKNRHIYRVGTDGKLEAYLRADDVIKIMADGYDTQVVNLSAQSKEITVKLAQLPVGMDPASRVHLVTGETIDARRIVGAYSAVSGEVLEQTPTGYIQDALGGRLNGLFQMKTSTLPGSPSWTQFIRAKQGDFTVMVDGVERSIDYLDPETIESVQLLKDATLKSLYGGIQNNGILMITTRRGVPNENQIRVNVQSGVQMPTRLPKYLNAYDYTSLYNQALINSGFDPAFNPEDYLNGDPIRYPDVDYYDQFLKNAATITRANAQLSGGSERTQYFAHFGFQNEGGLENYTKYPNKNNVFTLRGNIDNTILGFITLRAGFNAVFNKRSWFNVDASDFFGALSGNRPTEFPIFIPGDLVGRPDKEFVLGGTADNQNNPYGFLMNRGYYETEHSYIQSDFSLDVDLNRWVKGLRVRPQVTFDVDHTLNMKQGDTFAVYEPVYTNDNVSFLTWGQDKVSTGKSRSGNGIQRNWAINLSADYDRTFGKHAVTAHAMFFQQGKKFASQLQQLRRINLGGMVNYMYDNKYVAEVSVNYVGVGSFAPGKRFGTFPAFGAGWILSEESFMKTSWLDYLKVRASYGILGSTSYANNGLLSAFYYRDEWTLSGTYGVTDLNNRAYLSQTGNPDIGFQKSYELNVGVDFEMFNRAFSGSLTYFNNKLDGGFANMSAMMPGVLGKNGALIMYNYKKYANQGIEAELAYTKRWGDWNVSVGGNFTYGTAEVTREVDPNYPAGFEGLRKVSKVGDVKGLQVIGTFTDANDIATSPKQQYGVVQPGDLKYKDVNNDGYIDDKDLRVIANTTPSVQYGITVDIEWKGFNLNILGYGLAGFDRMLDNTYYQIYGTRKYSNVLKDGLPNGNAHPILRAQFSNNNYKDSDYWVVDGGFFKLRNVELGYTFNHDLSSKIGLNSLKVFVRGTNLFTLSKIKDLDPEALNAGITGYPLMTTITGGISFTF